MKSADAKALATKQRAAAAKNKAANKAAINKKNPNTVSGRLNLAQTTGQVNETGPFGSRTFTTDKDGRTIATTDLGTQQPLYNQQLERDTGLGNIAQGQLAQVQQSASTPFSLAGIGNDPTQFNYQSQRDAAEKRVYDRFASRNEPRFDKELKMFDAQMASEGVPQGSDKYIELKKALTMQQQDQRDSAGTQAFQLGGNEESQAYNQGLSSRQQGVSEYGQARAAPYTDMANTISLQKGLMVPQFTNPGAVDGAGIASSIAQENTAQYAATHKGGGGGGDPPFSLANYAPYQSWQAQQEYLRQHPQKGPSLGQQIGGVVGQVAGPALGLGLGSWLAG
jgi:hypothetical protein